MGTSAGSEIRCRGCLGRQRHTSQKLKQTTPVDASGGHVIHPQPQLFSNTRINRQGHHPLPSRVGTIFVGRRGKRGRLISPFCSVLARRLGTATSFGLHCPRGRVGAVFGSFRPTNNCHAYHLRHLPFAQTSCLSACPPGVSGAPASANGRDQRPCQHCRQPLAKKFQSVPNLSPSAWPPLLVAP